MLVHSTLKPALGLLVLLSTSIAVSAKLEAYIEPGYIIDNHATVVDKNTQRLQSCHLYCKVKHVHDNNENETVPLTNDPWVVWQRKTKDNNYHTLKDVLYWHDEEGLYFMQSLRYYCSTETRERDIFNCGISIDRCSPKYFGDYLCEVYDFDYGSQVQQSVSLKRSKDSNSTECYMPRAENITVDLVTLDTNGLQGINLTWSYAERPRGVRYCNNSRQWQVRSFNSTTHFSFEDGKEPAETKFKQVEFQNTTHKRDTYFVFEVNSDLLRNNYFQFQILNLRLKLENEQLVPVIQKFNSSIYTFKNQIPASLTLPQINDEVISVTVGSELVLRCEATGNPRPTIFLLKDVFDTTWYNQDYGNGTTDHRVKTISPVTTNDAGVYVCMAYNTMVGPPEGKRRITDWKRIIVEVTEHQRTDVSATVHCNSYSGSVCNAYIQDNIDVYINGTAINGKYSILLNQAVSLIIDIRGHFDAKSNTTQNPNLLQQCKTLAEAMACHSVFPYCQPGDSQLQEPTPRPICKNTCDAFRPGGVCESFVNSHLSPPGFLVELMASCDERENPAGDNPECIPVPMERPPERAHSNHWCQSGNGQDYNGFVQRTESGLDCQFWQSPVPHQHPFSPSVYPELRDAKGYCRNPGGVGERPWCYTASTEMRWEYCDVPHCEECKKYNLAFCSSLPGYNSSSVYINGRSFGPGQLYYLEEEMRKVYDKVIKEEEETSWAPGCDFALKQLICHTTLPFCSSTNADPEAMAICSDQCQLLQVIEFCSPKVYTLLLGDRNSLSLPDCAAAQLPPQGGSNCMPSTRSLISEDHHRHVLCYNTSDYGQSYTGRRAVTQHGKDCQLWSEPHLLFDASHYPELDGADNFCRNPGQLRERPWCFTSWDSWDYCNLPSNCTDLPAENRDLVHNSSPSNQSVIPIVFTVVVAIVIVGIVVLSVVACRYNKIRRERTMPPLPLSLQHVKKYPSDMKMVENDNYVPLPNKMAITIKKFQALDRQMDKSSIRYIRQIGQGNFGVVFQGKMSGLLANKEEEALVAVKTLKDDCQEAMEDFAREAKIMLQFDHPNIIKLYGVCTEELPYYLVFEYMDQGDLTKFLRQNASSEQRRLMSVSSRHRSRTDSTISDDPPSFNVEQLTDMCKQIAKGMEYLAGINHVHRDLACRNCLVKTCTDKNDMTDSGFIIKIGDFGMSHDLYQRNYYRVQGHAVLPVRWMSPEAIIFGKFSTAGDVWSFGVTMWEIFSFAMQPYYGIANEEVTKLIRTGRHLDKPYDCPRSTYHIMEKCWNVEPSERPSFTEIHSMLCASRVSESSYDSSFCSDTMSQSGSDLDSDAFLEENSIDGVFLDVNGESQA